MFRVLSWSAIAIIWNHRHPETLLWKLLFLSNSESNICFPTGLPSLEATLKCFRFCQFFFIDYRTQSVNLKSILDTFIASSNEWTSTSVLARLALFYWLTGTRQNGSNLEIVSLIIRTTLNHLYNFYQLLLQFKLQQSQYLIFELKSVW